MDSRIGLDYIVENKDYTTKLAAGVSTVSKAIIHYNQLRSQGKIVDIMTAVSVICYSYLSFAQLPKKNQIKLYLKN